MSLFDIKSIVTLSQPLPNSVWAILCAIALFGILLRRSPIPENIKRRGSLIWATAFMLPVALIIILFAGDTKPTTAPVSPSYPITKATPQVPKTLHAEAVLPSLSTECQADIANTDGIFDGTSKDGRTVLLVRRSHAEKDPAKRITALDIAETKANADVVRYFETRATSERSLDVTRTATEFQDRVRSVATGTLSGARRRLSCYANGVAWVILELPIR